MFSFPPPSLRPIGIPALFLSSLLGSIMLCIAVIYRGALVTADDVNAMSTSYQLQIADFRSVLDLYNPAAVARLMQDVSLTPYKQVSQGCGMRTRPMGEGGFLSYMLYVFLEGTASYFLLSISTL